jgi:hypothetical protein
MIFTSNYFCTPERLVDPFRGPSSLIFRGKQNYSGQGEKLTTDLHLMSMLRTSGVTPLWCAEGYLYDIFTFTSRCHNDDRFKVEMGGTRSTRGTKEKFVAYRLLLRKTNRRGPLVSQVRGNVKMDLR